MANPAPITLQQLFRYYRALPHQIAALVTLEEDIESNGYAVAMRRDRPWFATWSQDGKQSDPSKPVETAIKLNVPWYSQNDNISGTGYRECFSSSCSMLASFWGKLTGGDDAFNRIRATFGDSTDAQAQLRALRSLGLLADFRTDGTTELLRQELRAGRPVAVGWLHKGPITAPSGGGHWTVVTGWQPQPRAWVMNDPNGEADLVNGGYTAKYNGANRIYSEANWNPRWMPGGSGGWMLTCRKQ
jgi:hypothetical protein